MSNHNFMIFFLRTSVLTLMSSSKVFRVKRICYKPVPQSSLLDSNVIFVGMKVNNQLKVCIASCDNIFFLLIFVTKIHKILVSPTIAHYSSPHWAAGQCLQQWRAVVGGTKFSKISLLRTIKWIKISVLNFSFNFSRL